MAGYAGLIPLVLDAETFYTDKAHGAYGLTHMTAEEYIRDPRFDLIGFSLKKAEAPSQWYTGTLDYLRSVLGPLPWHRILLIGHNMSMFDSLIVVERLGFRPAMYACTLQMARALHGGKQSNSLAKLGELYGLKAKGHQVQNYINMRRADFNQWQLDDYGSYCNNDNDMCWELFKKFVPQFPTNELELMSLATRMWAEPRLALDGNLLQGLATQMASRKQALMGKVAGLLSVDTTQPTWIESTVGLLRKDAILAGIFKNTYDLDPPMKASPKQRNPDGTPVMKYAFAKTDEGMSALLEYEDDSEPEEAEEIQALAAARLSVKSTLAESRVNRFLGMSQRGLLPVPLGYGMTGTHRFNGMQKINMQNLSGSRQPTAKTPAFTILSTPNGLDQLAKINKRTKQLMCLNNAIYDWKQTHVAGLRDTIMAPPGKMIVVCDSSQIELRVAHMLAGQMDTIDELRQGIDVYSSFASTIYGRTITKADYKERQHGKVGMLQLQYQSGARSFKNAARIMGGVRLTDDEADNTVRTYRSRFTELPKFWWRCQQSIKKMANGGANGFLDQWGLCRVDHQMITLLGRPSLPLHYYNLREELQEGFNGGEPELQWVYDNKEARHTKKIYGGSITENLCQSLARNIVFDQMLEAERRWGTKPDTGVVLTVHDEIVLVVDENDAEECLQFVLGVMKQAPYWWPMLPVAAEGGIGKRYADAK